MKEFCGRGEIAEHFHIGSAVGVLTYIKLEAASERDDGCAFLHQLHGILVYMGGQSVVGAEGPCHEVPGKAVPLHGAACVTRPVDGVERSQVS